MPDKRLVRRLTFPNHKHVPTQAPKSLRHAAISSDVAIELFRPKFHARLWHRRSFALCVAMPEAAMHEYDGFEPGKNDIGAARQILPVKAKPKTQGMSDAPHRYLGRRVRLPHLRHTRAVLKRHLCRFFFLDIDGVWLAFKYFLHWRARTSANKQGSALPTMLQASSMLDVSRT